MYIFTAFIHSFSPPIPPTSLHTHTHTHTHHHISMEQAAAEQARLEKADAAKRAVMNTMMERRLRMLNCSNSEVEEQQSQAKEVHTSFTGFLGGAKINVLFMRTLYDNLFHYINLEPL